MSFKGLYSWMELSSKIKTGLIVSVSAIADLSQTLLLLCKSLSNALRMSLRRFDVFEI